MFIHNYLSHQLLIMNLHFFVSFTQPSTNLNIITLPPVHFSIIAPSSFHYPIIHTFIYFTTNTLCHYSILMFSSLACPAIILPLYHLTIHIQHQLIHLSCQHHISHQSSAPFHSFFNHFTYPITTNIQPTICHYFIHLSFHHDHHIHLSKNHSFFYHHSINGSRTVTIIISIQSLPSS